ncbi:MAG: hypothetical protein LBV30_00465, partial [Propionibacteriaceae bacterium]|nr:hypothetical protein [Propionibacteriaceae bacterium]
MPLPSHIIWDWNGTLLADTALTVECAQAALAAIGRPCSISLDQWRSVATRPILTSYEVFAKGPIGASDWTVLGRRWMELYLANLDGVSLNDQAVAAL